MITDAQVTGSFHANGQTLPLRGLPDSPTCRTSRRGSTSKRVGVGLVSMIGNESYHGSILSARSWNSFCWSSSHWEILDRPRPSMERCLSPSCQIQERGRISFAHSGASHCFVRINLTERLVVVADMPRPDRYDKIEVHLLGAGALTLLFGGHPATIAASRPVVFWAAIPP